MLLTDKELQIMDFAVNKDYGDDEPFFRLITDAGEVQLPKLQFQKDQPLPDYLSCRIKGYNGALPVLGHNMPRYVSEFYADGFSKQKEFEFRVISIADAAKGYYRLADDNGLLFNLHETKTILTRGQMVKCKFERLEQNFFKLYRSTTDKQFQMYKLSQIASKLEIHGLNAVKLENILAEIPEMKNALDEMNHGRSIWVITAIRAIRSCLPRLFSNAIEQYSCDLISEAINGYERFLLFLLQGSDFLRNIKGLERTELQAEITAQIEQLDIYRQTLSLVATQSERKFINGLLNNLKKSGYIYHPTTQFSIMMTLFRMSPELVNSSLRDIFDALMGWDLTTWKTEPFRQAFVEQLEIYIQDTRVEIDSFLQAETVADNEIIIRVLTAIAIQQSLSTESDSIDMRLNKSLFYRYLSVLKNAKAAVLLEKSYLALMGVYLPTDYIWSDIKEPTMMMTRASVDPPKNAVLPSNPVYFISGNIEVEVGPEGITIEKTDDDAMNIVPNGMLSWPGLKVNVSSKAFNRQKIRTLEGHAEFWSNIETSLFLPDTEVISSVLDSQTKRTPYIDDIVRIEIDRVITNASDSNRIEGFECKIVDDHFIECRGLLPASNLVNYNLHGVTVGTFRHDDGRHMQFDAQVVDIDDNDTLIFSLEESAQQAIRDLANVGEKCYCVVTKDNGRSYSAISENGFGLYVNKEDLNEPPFRKGNVILVTITGNNYGAIQSVVEDGPIDNFFSNAHALHNLLEAIAVNDYSGAEDIQFDEDDLISAEDLREIIEIFRFKASSESDILSAFDYLSYARLLAIIIGDEQLASTLKAHKDILQLHQYYAKNKRIDPEAIEKIISTSPESVYISRMASRLKIVASMGHSDENTELWNILNSSGIEIEKELAQMVLSYNLLYDMNRDNPTLAGIQDSIAKKLNVSSEQRDLKYYGAESQYVEFKSSLVYPARKGKSGLSVADPDRQEFEILHIIAGFLNSTGGTLYIGVNDDHYERGLDEDFTFYRMDNTERNTKFRRSIKTLDNYANYLQNLIDNKFSLGKNAGDYAKAYIDEESVKGVVAVKIAPCPHIVYLENTIYVRHGGKTEPYTRIEEINMLKSDRKQLYNQLMSAAENKETDRRIARDATSATSLTPALQKAKLPAPESSGKEETDDVSTSSTSFSVATSEIRKNIFHEYQDPDHFVTPKFYIRFVGDHDYIVTTDEWKINEDTDRLILAVSEEEAEGYLLLVYEGEYAIKVKMSEILEKNMNTTFSHYADKKLIFASPVSMGAGLYSLHSNSKNTLYERLTPIEKITQGSIGTIPERIMDCGSVNSLMWEIVSEESVRDFKDILSTEMKRTQIGSLLKGVTSVNNSLGEVKKILLRKLS